VADDRFAPQHGSEAWLYHDLVRLGDPRTAHDRLPALTHHGESPLVDAYAKHATAAATGDPDQLMAASDQFENLGAFLYATETALAASHVYRRHDRARPATHAEHRAATLARHCEGARTPATLTPASPVPLTRREYEIATLAATGATTKQIADTLHLSARTVDNHLRNTYVKLGITRRTQLRTALDTGR
jgi:DNA-binding NarL/FixJ family response regulator